jgi:Rrf2 family transcriptional regulator, nitric oxide-sensitive transcriptional repressor
LRLTAFTDYSLRVLIFIASAPDYSLRVLIFIASAPDERATIAQVARVFGVSEHHLVKVVHQLGRLGVLVNTRGRGGGLRLARPAAAINVGEVVRATEGSDIAAECFDRERNTCPIAGKCRLERALAEAVEAFHAVLARYTLEDLVSNRRVLARILHIPRASPAAALPPL